MKTLVLANQKGGVGKSAIACQFAYYLSQVLKLRTLVLDFDHQGNSSKALRASGLVSVANQHSAALLTGSAVAVDGAFALVASDVALSKLERQPEKHNEFAGALMEFLASVDGDFDVCLIDTNPNPDIRLTVALVAADYALSPIQLNQEALDGIGALNRDINNIKAKLNPKLTLLGILPNLVENTPFQKANLQQLVEHFSKLLIRLPGKGKFAFIPTRTAIAEAQAAGKPIWALGKTSARTAWAEIKPVFEKLTADMELV